MKRNKKGRKVWTLNEQKRTKRVGCLCRRGERLCFRGHGFRLKKNKRREQFGEERKIGELTGFLKGSWVDKNKGETETEEESWLCH